VWRNNKTGRCVIPNTFPGRSTVTSSWAPWHCKQTPALVTERHSDSSTPHRRIHPQGSRHGMRVAGRRGRRLSTRRRCQRKKSVETAPSSRSRLSHSVESGRVNCNVVAWLTTKPYKVRAGAGMQPADIFGERKNDCNSNLTTQHAFENFGGARLPGLSPWAGVQWVENAFPHFFHSNLTWSQISCV